MELQSIMTVHLNPSLPRFSSLSIPISLSNPFYSKNSTSALRLSISRQSHFNPKPLSVSSAAASSAIQTDKKDRLPANVKVTETKEPNSRVRLSVEVPPIVCQDCYKRVLDEFSKQSKVEGRALKDSVQIGTKFSEMDEDFSPQDFLSYVVIVDVAPEVKWMSENAYKNLKVVVEIDNEIDAQRASEAELRRRHKALGALKIVTDRGLQQYLKTSQVGDVAVLDIFATTIGKDNSGGEKIPFAEKKGFSFDTEDGDYLIPGFLNSIIGIQRGETKSFPLLFPESWKQENLRGVYAQFTVECKELFYRDLPELNDSLSDKLLPGCSTLSQVRELILQRCREVEQTAREQATDNAILDQLCKLIDIDIPQSLFEEQGRQLYGARLLELQASTKLDEQQLASLSSEKAVNEFLEIQRENITNMIKQMLSVGEIFKLENLQFPTEELVKEVENSVAEFKRHNQEYDEEHIREQVQDILEGAKVLEWLREHADIEYITR
ncbi:trigger factor-like protein TIG, Chloroplastic isoform X3 [Magnolia sinica]|uniref:trigger factor-like protein TIG, Chloroplastic isoform X3 n=1 Tax=Magnolia sinica TaxID=86752 RepID=UPI0026582EDD|nr:trigger factor-like protein TIG, Chloroplastic isoform X3 [Magnolia sinica]